MFVVTLNKTSLKKVGAGALCCALVIFSAFLGRYISTRTVAAAAGVNRIESAQDIQTWFTGYGLDVDGASIPADKVKIPRKRDDSSGETSRYGVLLVYRKKAVGAYLLEKPSGTVIGLKDAQTAMAQAEQQDAQQVSGEDYSGDWGERHDEELGAAGQSQQTSGEPDSVVPEEAQYTDLPLDAEGYPVE